jgi:hypothetical protein
MTGHLPCARIVPVCENGQFSTWLRRFRAVGLGGFGVRRGCPGNTAGRYITGCAPFCAHPQLKTITNGRREASVRIASTGAENQHHSKQSHAIGDSCAATVNRRVASSNLARDSCPIRQFAVVRCREVGANAGRFEGFECSVTATSSCTTGASKYHLSFALKFRVPAITL